VTVQSRMVSEERSTHRPPPALIPVELESITSELQAVRPPPDELRCFLESAIRQHGLSAKTRRPERVLRTKPTGGSSPIHSGPAA